MVVEIFRLLKESATSLQNFLGSDGYLWAGCCGNLHFSAGMGLFWLLWESVAVEIYRLLQ